MELKFQVLKDFEKSYLDNTYYQVVNLNNKKYFLDLAIKSNEDSLYEIKEKYYHLPNFLEIFSCISKNNKINFGETILNNVSKEILKYIIFLEKNNNGDIDFSIKVIFKNKKPFKFNGYFIDEAKHQFLLLQKEKEEIEKEIAIDKSRFLVRKKLISLYNKYDISEIEYDDFNITLKDLKEWDTNFAFSYEEFDGWNEYTKYCKLSTLKFLAQELQENGLDEDKYVSDIHIY